MKFIFFLQMQGFLLNKLLDSVLYCGKWPFQCIVHWINLWFTIIHLKYIQFNHSRQILFVKYNKSEKNTWFLLEDVLSWHLADKHRQCLIRCTPGGNMYCGSLQYIRKIIMHRSEVWEFNDNSWAYLCETPKCCEMSINILHFRDECVIIYP